MDEGRFIPYLKELAKKYAAMDALDVKLEPGKVIAACGKENYTFIYDFSLMTEVQEENFVPLLHWRNKRRYVELKNLLLNKMIENPLAMRIHHIVPKGEFDCSLLNIIAYETDLAEFITGQSVDRIFADFSGKEYTNCIASTNGNIKVSMELGFSPEGSEPVLLHEIVARTGIASDVAVDTQTQQYPIYVFKGSKVEHYTDIDNELYGLDNTQADCIRFILGVLERPEGIEALREQGRHLLRVYRAAEAASEKLCYTEVGEGK